MGTELTYSRIQLDIETLLQSLNISDTRIVGFSDGGIVAYRMAIDSAVKISKLVTIGATWNISDLVPVEEMFLKITSGSWRAKFPESFNSYHKLNPEPDFDKLIKSIVAMWLDKTATGFPNENVSKINCPALIVRGDKDHLFSRQSVFKLADLIPNSALLNIPFAGDLAHEEQLEIFTNSLKQFLKQE